MDRKGWIVITLCLILLGLNMYYMQENQKLAAAQAQEARQKAEEAKRNAPATPEAAQSAPAAAAATPAPSGGTNLPEQKHSFTVGSVTYEFTSKGGGIARAVL